ncbi:MAG: hypothetical protein ACE5KX_03325 [Acidimicrobiia bacterium]
MAEGVVFDLGYRPHEGERLGRKGAVSAVIRDGLRRVLGLRRKARRKVLPFVLLAIALLPAAFFVGVGVVAGEIVDPATVFGHPGYFDLTGPVALIFIALAASELLIPDRSYGTLAIYASRPLRLTDYLAARAAALALLVIGFLYLPHLVLLFGQAAVAREGFGSYLVDNLDVLWKAAAGSLVYFVAYASVAFLVAAIASRVPMAAGIFLGVVTISGPTTAALTDSGLPLFSLGALQHHPGYVKDWIFGTSTHNWIPERAGYEPALSLAVIAVLALAAALLLLRRYRRLA